MDFLEIAITTTSSASELVAEILFEETGEGVAIFDKVDFLSADFDYCDQEILDNLKEEVVVKGFLSKENFEKSFREITARIAEIAKSVDDCGSLGIAYKEIDSNEWLVFRKKFSKPTKVGDLTICPLDFADEVPERGRVLLDVGMAFGTGEHETTRMCLQLLQEQEVFGKNISDIGCGSGILGIAALKLGGKQCFFVDNDTQAAEATQNNLKLNGFEGRAQVKCGSLEQFTFEADIVLANLTAEIICHLFDGILAFGKRGSVFVFSGILQDRLGCVTAKLQESGLEVVKICQMGEWQSIIAKFI